MDDLARLIREHVLNGDTNAVNHQAVLAVVDKCEQMRAESASAPGGVGHFFTDEFETVIARALGLIN